MNMSKIETIGQQIESLSPRELSSFRHWFATFDSKAWDRAFEEDASSGKLDTLADEALKKHREGKSSAL